MIGPLSGRLFPLFHLCRIVRVLPPSGELASSPPTVCRSKCADGLHRFKGACGTRIGRAYRVR
jgi:hypothetical protein